MRPQLDGRAFPDKLIALTWDDGPDKNTLALASYLSEQHVSATFFVVREWNGDVSADPGTGKEEFETGYEYLPILGDLVQLGHRIGNHTLHHVILSQARADTVDEELKENQEWIDPYLTNELRLFRAPGGAWNAKASRATDADPYLADFVGPIRWDIDRKDWENSLSCRSSRPLAECEPGPTRSRVRADVVARRYLASIESAGHGVVLFHDRVGDVGSAYALELAQHLIPELVRRGYVFVAPVLGFVEPTPRLAADREPEAIVATSSSLLLGDLDGDGRADACLHAAGDKRCALSVELRGTEEDRRPHTVFSPSPGHGFPGPCAEGFESEDVALADVDGDRRADACATMGFGVACALNKPIDGCGPAAKWLLFSREAREDAAASGGALEARFGDLDGDGRADTCLAWSRGIRCALSNGRAFDADRLWIAPADGDDGWLLPSRAGSIVLADVDGDGRADACGRSEHGLMCARSTGRSFARAELWSAAPEMAGAARVMFGDLNGDARADVCAATIPGVVCALSTGRAFTRPSPWLTAAVSAEASRIAASVSLALGDVNGDGRDDLCGYDRTGVVCALAP